MKLIGIYKITSPTNRIYIGQSSNIKKRFTNYKSLDCKKQKRLYNSFLKHGVENHKFEILCQCELSELNTKERHYQDLFSVLTSSGLNCTLTEHESIRREYSIETRKKMSDSRKGIKLSDETKAKLRAIGKAQGGGYKIGHKHSEESKIKMSLKKTGRKQSESHKQSRADALSKKVINKVTGEIYRSIRYCADSVGIKPYTLVRYLNGKRKNKTNFILL